GSDVDQREADAIDGNRSLGNEERGPERVDGEDEEFPFPFGTALAEGGGGVDMSLDEVAAQPVADPERPFEVDPVARAPASQVGAGQGLRPSLDSDPRPQGGDDSQTAPVDRHTLARLQRLTGRPVRPVDRESTARVFLDGELDSAQSCD